MTTKETPTPEDFRRRLEILGLRGLIENWDEYHSAEWLPRLVEIEEKDRARRGLERRLRNDLGALRIQPSALSKTR